MTEPRFLLLWRSPASGWCTREFTREQQARAYGKHIVRDWAALAILLNISTKTVVDWWAAE